jgi:hypothetical protein
MKREFEIYLDSVGIAGPIKNRIGFILEDFEQICPQEINDIFISEFIKDDGTREYESLWFFSNLYVMEAKKFINEDDFDISPIAKRISYFKATKKEYRFGIATDQSRLLLDFSTNLHVKCTLKASKTNCSELWKIFLKYVKPNLIPISS